MRAKEASEGPTDSATTTSARREGKLRLTTKRGRINTTTAMLRKRRAGSARDNCRIDL